MNKVHSFGKFVNKSLPFPYGNFYGVNKNAVSGCDTPGRVLECMLFSLASGYDKSDELQYIIDNFDGDYNSWNYVEYLRDVITRDGIFDSVNDFINVIVESRNLDELDLPVDNAFRYVGYVNNPSEKDTENYDWF